MRQTSVHVIWNAQAGAAAANQDVLEMFERHSDISVHQPDTSDDARTLVEQLSRQGAATIVAAGGDGSVNAVLQGLMAAGRNRS